MDTPTDDRSSPVVSLRVPSRSSLSLISFQPEYTASVAKRVEFLHTWNSVKNKKREALKHYLIEQELSQLQSPELSPVSLQIARNSRRSFSVQDILIAKGKHSQNKLQKAREAQKVSLTPKVTKLAQKVTKGTTAWQRLTQKPQTDTPDLEKQQRLQKAYCKYRQIQTPKSPKKNWSGVIKRNSAWMTSRETKINNLKKELQSKELQGCTFSPQLTPYKRKPKHSEKVSETPEVSNIASKPSNFASPSNSFAEIFNKFQPVQLKIPNKSSPKFIKFVSSKKSSRRSSLFHEISTAANSYRKDSSLIGAIHSRIASSKLN